MVTTVSNLLAELTIFGQALILAEIIYYFVRRGKTQDTVFDFLSRDSLRLAFAVALAATLGSLFYSEVAGFAPCGLCWYQRILMYPQAVILGLAAWKNDKNIAPYSLVLSLIGAVIAAYHYYIQVGGAPVTSCSLVGYSASCSAKFAMQFGYITIPLMSLTAFLLIALAMVLAKRMQIKNT